MCPSPMAAKAHWFPVPTAITLAVGTFKSAPAVVGALLFLYIDKTPLPCLNLGYR